MSNFQPNPNGSTPNSQNAKIADPFAFPAVTFRPVHTSEVMPALQLILGTDGRLGDPDHAIELMKATAHRGINLADIWVCETQNQLRWAALPIVSPGRTVLYFGTSATLLADDPAPMDAGIDGLNRLYADRGVKMAQMLIDPADILTIQMYQRHQFQVMAELVYLQRNIRRAKRPLPLPGEFRLVNYSSETHAGFAQAISDSYQDSLDCPAMNGMREIEDVLAGHKAAGVFNPSDWFLLLHGNEPVAVLLLGMTHQTDGLELVYLGLSPKVRGYGIGNYLLQLAEARVCERKVARLSLAVDQANAPALKLYYRHGMKQMMRKIALMRGL